MTETSSTATTRAQHRLAELGACITEVDPADALSLQARGAALIDVREPEEIAQGTAPGTLRLGRGFLELRIEQAVERGRTVVLMCGSGVRSLFAADDLIRLGYEDVRSLRGGFARWRQEGLPVEIPQ